MKQNKNEDAFLIGNEKIEEAIATFGKERSEPAYHAFMEILRKRSNEDGHFIIPVHHAKGVSGFEWLSINSDTYEKPLAAAFTSNEEFQKGQKTEAISHYIDALFDIALDNDSFDGIILNPWGEAIVLGRFDLQAIKLANRRFGDGRQVSVCDDTGDGTVEKLVTADENESAEFCQKILDKALHGNIKDVAVPAIKIGGKTMAESSFIVLSGIYGWLDAHTYSNIHITIRCPDQESWERYDTTARVLNAGRAADKYKQERMGKRASNNGNVFEAASKNEKFYIKRSTYEAAGIIVDKDFVVLKGSTINPDITGVMPRVATDAREACIENGILDKNFRLGADVRLPSLSAAAAFVVGHTVSGPMTWRNGAGKTIKEAF